MVRPSHVSKQYGAAIERVEAVMPEDAYAIRVFITALRLEADRFRRELVAERQASHRVR
jgi:hypothetical protein